MDNDAGTGPDAQSSSRVTERFWAGALRILIATFCVVVLPWVVPSAKSYRLALWGYLGCTVLFQVAIAKDFGGRPRALFGALLDIAMTTFIVHRLGSTSTPFAAVYCLLATFYALVTPTEIAIAVSVVGAVSYGAVCFSDALGMTTYAPDFPELSSHAPSLAIATASVLVLSAFVLTASVASHRVARTLRKREQQLLEGERLLREANARLEELSQRDPLTQLVNRRHLVERLEDGLARVRRGEPMSVLMIDLDGFKKVNDVAGHLTGDDLLRNIATAMTSATRETDVVGRFGGDEFFVILANADREDASAAATRLTEAVREAAAAMDLPVTASIGIAVADPDQDVASLIALADGAAYHAKRSGGDRWTFTADPMPASGPPSMR